MSKPSNCNPSASSPQITQCRAESIASADQLEVARIRELSKARRHPKALTAAEALAVAAPTTGPISTDATRK
jgi:hypothetical protein